MERIDSMIYEDPQTAFNEAIEKELLSNSVYAWNYAANFMYMGTVRKNGARFHQFKHSATRRYLNGDNGANKEIAAFQQADNL